MTKENQVEPTQEIPENTETPTTEPVKEPSIDERVADIEAKLTEKFKADINGLNRKVSEVTKERDELKKKTMTEDEQREAERRELAERAERAEAEKNEILKTQMKKDCLANEGLPVEFAKFISGEEETDIKNSVDELSKYIKDSANKLKEEDINRRLSGKAPVAGSSPDVSDLQSAYNEAKKKGDTASMIAIKRRGKTEGVTIT